MALDIKDDDMIPTNMAQSLGELVGNTPMLQAHRYSELKQIKAKLFLKLEYLNPSGSVKDRLAKALIADGEARGLIQQNSVIIEPTSGNTGIGLAALAAAKGYRCILTMPETMSEERRNLLKAYGAEIVLTEGTKGMTGAIAKAQELAESIPHAYLPGQFTNPINAKMHMATTGPEIWQATQGQVDAFVAGVGTGGTISGVRAALLAQKPDVRIIAVEPADSPVLSQGKSGPHKIQGIGAGFIPETLDTKSYHEIITVDNEQAFRSAKELAQSEGILCGISSGAALYAATLLAQKEEYAGKNIVVLLPDSADRYYSTPLFQ